MAMKSSTAAKLIASDFATLDLKRIRAFIKEAVTEGAIAGLISTIIALLTRMRDLNQELARQLAWKNRKRPASERMHRLQLELPFVAQAEAEATANDASDSEESDPEDTEKEPRKQRKRKKPDQTNRDAHGRPKFPGHMPRVEGDVELVTGERRICPHCATECAHVTFKVCQKLDVEPARYVVRENKREVVACQQCHGHVVTAPKRDEVLDRGVLGEELLVQSLVDHYQDAVPWERMERKARQERAAVREHARIGWTNEDNAVTVAHEFGHILLGAGHIGHSGEGNLMAAGAAKLDTQLTGGQCATARSAAKQYRQRFYDYAVSIGAAAVQTQQIDPDAAWLRAPVDQQQLARICCQIDGDYFSLPKFMCSLQGGTQSDGAQCRTCCAVSDPANRGDDGSFSITPVDQCAEDRRLARDQCDSVCCKKDDSGNRKTRYDAWPTTLKPVTMRAR